MGKLVGIVALVHGSRGVVVHKIVEEEQEKEKGLFAVQRNKAMHIAKKHIVVKRTMKYGNLQLVISTVTMVVYLTVAIVNVHLGGKVTAATKVIFIIFLLLLGLLLLY